MHYSDIFISPDAVRKMICEFACTARHPDLPPLRVSELLDPQSAITTSQAQSGVYLLYREDKSLAYIGMSLTNVARRLGQHLSAREQASNFWQTRAPAFAQTVLVTFPWEPPSLEEFLVRGAQELASRSS